MLYLIRSYKLGGKPILKVGYTDNLSNRMNQYFYHNPGCEVVSVRQGNEVLEGLFHIYLRFLGLQYKRGGRLEEWFVGDSRIYQLFHLPRKTLEKNIWKNREKIFDSSKLSIPGSPMYNLFEYLWRKNNKILGGGLVDKAFWGSWLRKNPESIDDFLDFL